jgi:hypothetical protein
MTDKWPLIGGGGGQAVLPPAGVKGGVGGLMSCPFPWG